MLALVEHAADEARDRISRVLPGGKVALPGGWCVVWRHSIRNELLTARVSASLARAPLLSWECLCHCRVQVRSPWYSCVQLLVLTGLSPGERGVLQGPTPRSGAEPDR